MGVSVYGRDMKISSLRLREKLLVMVLGSLFVGSLGALKARVVSEIHGVHVGAVDPQCYFYE